MHREHFPTEDAGSAAKLNPDVGWGLGGVFRARRFPSLVGRAGSIVLWPNQQQQQADDACQYRLV